MEQWQIILTAIGSLLGTGGISALLKLWWDKRLERLETKEKAKLAKTAMKYDKEDSEKIYDTYIKSTSKKNNNNSEIKK